LEREQREAEARAKKLEEERLLRVCDACNIDCGIVYSWSLTLRHSLQVRMTSDLTSMASFQAIHCRFRMRSAKLLSVRNGLGI